MEWEEELKDKVIDLKHAIEAHRLRCNSLFGNLCMNSSQRQQKKPCDGNCYYIKSYKFELFKIESNAASKAHIF